MVKTVAIVCGAGVVASALIAEQVRKHCEAKSIPAKIEEATVMDLLSPDFSADIIVTTVTIPPSIGIPLVSGMPLLLGTDPEATFEHLDSLLTA